MFRMLFSVPFLFSVFTIMGCDVNFGSSYKVQQGVVADAEVSTHTNDGFANDTLAWGGSDSTVTEDDTTQVTDGTTDPPEDSHLPMPECERDLDCVDRDSFTADECIEGECTHTYNGDPCLNDRHCTDNFNMCSGEERCIKENPDDPREPGYCTSGEPLVCPDGFECHPVTGCRMPGPLEEPECLTPDDCSPGEVCNDTLGGACSVADGADCTDDIQCDDLSACTPGYCLDTGKCQIQQVICDDRNEATKDVCYEFVGCTSSLYIKVQITLNYPYNRDMVWLRFGTKTWYGNAPYEVQNMEVVDACSAGVRLDFNTDGASEIGWYGCPGNPSFNEAVESITVDGRVFVAPYDVRDDPEAPCGKSIYVTPGDLSCPYF